MCIRDRNATQLPLCCLTQPAALCSWQCHHLVCCCQMTAAAIESATEDNSPDDACNPSNGTAQAGAHYVEFHAVAALLPHQASRCMQLAVPPLSLQLPIIDSSCIPKRHGGHPPAAHVSQATAQHKRAHTTSLSTQLPLCCPTKPAAPCSCSATTQFAAANH